jgi:integrase
MQKLRFKNRNGILYFGFGDKFKSSKLKYSMINKNIIIGKFKSGSLSEELNFISEDAPLVTKLLEEVMSEKESSLKHNSILSYRTACTTSIIPYFKNKFVSDVKPIDIKMFQDSMVKRGLKRQSLATVRVLMKELFDIAIIREYITINPVKMVGMPKIKLTKEKPKPFTLDEIDLILKNTTGSIKNFLGISFFTGMRSGELLALRWDDIDFTTDTISISNTIASGVINSAKTKSSVRDIELLDEARKYFKAQQLLTGLKNEFVFMDKNSYYGHNKHFYGFYQRVLKTLNIEARNLHNTRHTFASMMLNNGIDPLWVSNMLGHENLNITLQIYTHYMPKKEKMVIGFLNNRYKNGTK